MQELPWLQGKGQGGGRCCHPCPCPPSLAPLQKVMHTRKRHSELYHELNQKFHTLDRYRAPATNASKVQTPLAPELQAP